MRVRQNRRAGEQPSPQDGRGTWSKLWEEGRAIRKGWNRGAAGKGRAELKIAWAPPLAALPRNNVTSSIRERARGSTAFYIREASGFGCTVKVRRRVLCVEVVIGAELFGLVRIQKFQESCRSRSTSALKTFRFENLKGLRCSLGHETATCSPGCGVWSRARTGQGPSGKGSAHMTPAKVVNSAVGVKWPSWIYSATVNSNAASSYYPVPEGE